MLGDGEDQTNKKSRRRRKVFCTKAPQNKEAGSDTGSTLGTSNLLCSQLPAPAIRRGATGGHIGAIFAPMAPSLATAFKVLHCDAHGLDVCLVPYMQSYHYPCLLTIAGPSLFHLQLFASGYDMTVRLISPLLHIAPCVSLCFCSDCVPCLNHSDLKTWKIFYLSSPCDTSVALMRFFR